MVSPLGAAGASAFRVIFDRYMTGGRSPAGLDRTDLVRYFVTRRAVERNELAHLSVTDLNHCREARRQFADPLLETLYARWLVDGDCVLGERDPGPHARVVSRGAFRACELPFTYEQFGDEAGVC